MAENVFRRDPDETNKSPQPLTRSDISLGVFQGVFCAMALFVLLGFILYGVILALDS
jgi:hypothetical protein